MNRAQNSAEAEAIIHNLIVVQGLSYEDAVRRARAWGEAAVAPYDEAARVIQAQLDDFNEMESRG